MHPKGCENLKENLLHTPSHLAPRRGAVILAASTGGLRFATTTGYFLATLRVASLHFKLESTFLDLKVTVLCLAVVVCLRRKFFGN